MNSIPEALNILISSVNVAYNKGAFSMEEVYHIYPAISYIENLQKQALEQKQKQENLEQNNSDNSENNLNKESDEFN